MKNYNFYKKVISPKSQKIMLLLSFIILSMSIKAQDDLYWSATATTAPNNWNVDGNWKFFNGTSAHAPTSSDNVFFTTGMIDCDLSNSIYTVNNFTMDGYDGEFNAHDKLLQIQGDLIVHTGTFIASSFVLTLQGDFDYDNTDAIFNHNTGKVSIQPNSPIIAGLKNTFLTGDEIIFYDLFIGLPSNMQININNTSITVENKLEWAINPFARCILNGGVINVKGDIFAKNQFIYTDTEAGNTIININGAPGDVQTWEGILPGTTTDVLFDQERGLLPNVRIVNKLPGTLVLKGKVGVQSSIEFVNSENAILLNNDHELSLRGSGAVTTFDVLGNFNAGDLSFRPGSNCTYDFNGSVINVIGVLEFSQETLIGGEVPPLIDLSNGTIHAKSDINAFNEFAVDLVQTSVGDAEIIIDGNGLQTIYGNNLERRGRLPWVTINKPSGIVEIDNTVTIDGVLNFINGEVHPADSNDPTDLILLNSNATVSNASSSSFVSGPIKKYGNTGITFPVGKNGMYVPVEISGITESEATFTAEYFREIASSTTTSDHGFSTSNTEGTLGDVRDCEYWDVQRNSTNASALVTLHWGANNCESLTSSDQCAIQIARWGNPVPTQWKNEGASNMIGDLNLGSVRTESSISSFVNNVITPFTFARSANPINISITSQNISCGGTSDGSINITANGGNNPYQYSIDGCSSFQSTGSFVGLDVGPYTICVQDDDGCNTASEIVTIEQSDNIIISTIIVPVNCEGDVLGSITINATGGIPQYTYSIDNCVSSQSSNVFSNLSAGSYDVCVVDSNGCTESISVVVTNDGGDCCFASIDPDYTSVGGIYTTDQVWSNKIYVSSDVTIENNIFLDITNVDVVFAEGTGIIVTDGSYINATNSTFRPCNSSETWSGISYPENNTNTGGVFNENVFLSAEIGLDISSNGTIESSNNLFKNNQRGIRITGQGLTNALDHNISGNTFSVYNSTNFIGNHYGIEITNTLLSSVITLNDFINSDRITTHNLYGISISNLSRSINVLGNNFVDLYASIDVDNSSDISIENNEISIAVGFNAGDILPQIGLNDCSDIWVIENHIINTTEDLDFNIKNVGILCLNVQLSNIKANLIERYSIGIISDNSDQMYVSENVLEDNVNNGIRVINGTNNNILCNSINMAHNNIENNIGIYHNQDFTGQSGNIIASNCISEAYHAIVTDGTLGVGSIIPTIRNNYLYNYFNSGVRNIDNSGNIGTSFSSYANAGRNTFTSNNISATDISNTNSLGISLNVIGNYGIVSTAGPVVLGGINTYHSTASCGQQIIDASNFSNNNDEYLCDKFYDVFTPFLVVYNNKYYLAQDHFNELGNLEYKERVVIMNTMLNRLTTSESIDDIISFHQEVNSSELLVASDLNWFNILSEISMGNWLIATQLTSNISENSIEAINFKKLMLISINISSGLYDASNLSETDIIDLLEIYNNNGKYAQMASDFLQRNLDGYDHLYYLIADNIAPNTSEIIHIGEVNNLEIFPNPATNEINVQLVTKDNVSRISIADLYGREILSTNVMFNSGGVKVDISDLKTGVYIVSLVNKEEIIISKKLVKLN